MKLPSERFEYSAILDREPLRLPHGARVAAWTIVSGVPHRIWRGEEIADWYRGARAEATAVAPAPGAGTPAGSGFSR